MAEDVINMTALFKTCFVWIAVFIFCLQAKCRKLGPKNSIRIMNRNTVLKEKKEKIKGSTGRKRGKTLPEIKKSKSIWGHDYPRSSA